MTMLICIKQHLSNIWSSIHEKLSNTEIELKIIKKCVILTYNFIKQRIFWKKIFVCRRNFDFWYHFRSPNLRKTHLINPKLDSKIKSLWAVIFKMNRFLPISIRRTYCLDYRNMLEIHISEKASFFAKYTIITS